MEEKAEAVGVETVLFGREDSKAERCRLERRVVRKAGEVLAIVDTHGLESLDFFYGGESH